MSRSNTLSSSCVQRVEEEKIVEALKENGFPFSFIRKHSCPARHRQEVDVRLRRMVTLRLEIVSILASSSEPQSVTEYDRMAFFSN